VLLLPFYGLRLLVPRTRVKSITPLPRSLVLSADQLGLQPQTIADIVAYLQSAALQ